MKTIKRIAGAEFRLLFFSPIAWLVLIIFILQAGFFFSESLKFWMQQQESRGDIIVRSLGGLTGVLFTNRMGGFFSAVQQFLYLYVPLLTMGLMSREISSGTIKLLLSSPIRISQIVLGKFIAMMVYGLLFIGIMVLYILAGEILVGNLDMGGMIPGLLGTWLLICVYSAIGLFMSSLTPYQVVAALSTLGVLALLNYIGAIGQSFAWMRLLAYLLSLGSRVGEKMDQGLITSADIAYFFLMTGLFLFITILRMNDGRELRPGLVRVGRYAGLFALFLVVGWLSSRHFLTAYFDMTANKSQTISTNAQTVIKKIKGPLKVTAYTNLLGPGVDMGRPENRNTDYNFWEKYSRFKPDMEFSYVYYYDTSKDYNMFKWKPNVGKTVPQMAEKVADSYGYPLEMFETPAEIRRSIDLEPEEHRFVRQLEAEGKKSFLRFFDDQKQIPFEHEVIASIGRLTETPPRIVFASGDFERSIFNQDPNEYHAICRQPGLRVSLINQGFDMDTVALERQDIPAGIAVLVIADPKRPLNAVELAKINQYIANGGNLILAGDAGRQPLMNPVLASLGVHLQDGVLISPSKDYSPTTIRALISPRVSEIFDTTDLADSYNPAVFAKTFFMGAVGLGYTANGPYKVMPLVFSDAKNTWNKIGNYALDTIPKTYDSAAGDRKASVALALALSRRVGNREQRIVVLGDADMLSQNCIGSRGNNTLVVEMFKWLNYGSFPVNTEPKQMVDNDFRVSHKILPTVNTIFLGGLPGMLLLSCSVVLIRRRRK